MLPNILLNWWAAYRQIALPISICPASPEGQAQQGGAVVVAHADWTSLFYIAVVIAAVAALIMVFWTYQTRTMGAAFASRWRWTAFWTAVVSMVVCFGVLALWSVQTFGCQFGNRSTTLPLLPSAVRATVAFAQTAFFFFVWSVILTRFARVTRHQPWFDHSRFPV